MALSAPLLSGARASEVSMRVTGCVPTMEVEEVLFIKRDDDGARRRACLARLPFHFDERYTRTIFHRQILQCPANQHCLQLI